MNKYGLLIGMCVLVAGLTGCPEGTPVPSATFEIVDGDLWLNGYVGHTPLQRVFYGVPWDFREKREEFRLGPIMWYDDDEIPGFVNTEPLRRGDTMSFNLGATTPDRVESLRVTLCGTFNRLLYDDVFPNWGILSDYRAQSYFEIPGVGIFSWAKIGEWSASYNGVALGEAVDASGNGLGYWQIDLPQAPPPPQTFTLTTGVVGQGTATGGGVYPAGTNVVITANPAIDWHFVRWQGDIVGTDNPATVTMNSNVLATAVFAQDTPPPPDNYTLTTNVVGQGSVTGAGVYNSGAIATLTANPAIGWRFAGWTGDLAGLQNPANVTMNTNKGVTATFEQIPEPHTDAMVVFTTADSDSVQMTILPGQEDLGGIISPASNLPSGATFADVARVGIQWMSVGHYPYFIQEDYAATMTASGSQIKAFGADGFILSSRPNDFKCVPYVMVTGDANTRYYVNTSMVPGKWDGVALTRLIDGHSYDMN